MLMFSSRLDGWSHLLHRNTHSWAEQQLSRGGGGVQSGQDQVSVGRVLTCGTHTAASENTPPAGFYATVGNILGGAGLEVQVKNL